MVVFIGKIGHAVLLALALGVKALGLLVTLLDLIQKSVERVKVIRTEWNDYQAEAA